MELILTPAETTELRDLLASALADLRSELHHTSTSEYRRQLHAREVILHAMLDRVDAALPTAGTRA